MSTTVLTTIGSRFTISVGSILFSLGFPGNLITIYLLRLTRRTPVTFILIALSISNCISLIVGLLNRIIVAIVGIDPTLISPVWCKLRVYIGQTSVLFCQTCVCLASINCFLLTSRQLRWRRCVSYSIARSSVLIAALIWSIHGLFNPLLTELIIINGRSSTCSLTSSFALNYTGFFLRPMLIGVFPISILSIFGILTYRNLKKFHHRRRLEQQTVCKMLLFQILAYVLGTLPYASFYAYQSITSVLHTKSFLERARENFVLEFINIIFYTPQASPFYVYYFSSNVFRKQVRNMFGYPAQNQIQPFVRVIYKNQ